MAFVDYRPSSYRKIARAQRISRQLREQASEQQRQAESQSVNNVSNVTQDSNGVSSSKLSSVSPLASAVFKKEVSVSDVLSGKVKKVSDVSVSGGVAGKVARESDKPMSVREDVVYKTKGKIFKPNNVQLFSVDKKVEKNGSINNNFGNNILGISNNENYAEDKKQEKVPSFYEKQVSALVKYEQGARERSQRLSDFGEKVITSSPFRKTNEPLSFWEQIGAKGLSAPGKILVEYPEQTLVTGAKAVVFSEGLLFKPTRGNVIEEGKRAGREFVPSLKAGFDVTTSSGVVNIATSVAAPSFIKKSIDVPKGVFIKSGSKYVPTEKVFSSKVLSGEETLPTVGSIQESVSAFKSTRDSSGKIFVQTSSPSKISGNVAGVGKKASVGLEDTGIYVTPRGEGSPYFLRVEGGKVKPSYSFNINPLKGVTDQPTVTVFAAQDVVRLPRDVISKPGFKAVESFQESNLAGKGVVQITKRSELGQGSIPVDYSIKGKAKFGTSELEAVVPKGQKFVYTPSSFVGKVKGFEKYTIFEGKPVAIREADLVVGSSKLGKGSSFVSSGRIVSESRSLSSLGTSNVNVFVPRLLNGRVESGEVLSSSRVSVGSSNVSGGVSVSGLSSGVSSRSSVSRGSSGVKSNVGSMGGVSRGSGLKSNVGSMVSSPSSIGSSVVSQGSVSSPASSSRVSSLSSSSKYSPFRNTEAFKPSKNKLPVSKPKKEKGGLFSVELRRGGEFKSVGKGIGLGEAIKLGTRSAQGTAGRTFRIKKAGGEVVTGLKAGKGFYSGRGGNIIESSQNAINTSGELKEITFKGINTQKKNRNNFGSVI